jgi:membrane protease YdiL (CAAX protease family)
MSPLERLLLAVSVVSGVLLAGTAISAGAAALADDRLLTLCANAFVVELWLAGAALAGACLLRAPLRATLGLGPGRLGPREIALLVLGTLAASHALDGWLELTGRTQHTALTELPRVLEGARGVRLAVALMALGIAPGLAEEILCRGLIQRSATRRLGAPLGVSLAAGVFGALHGDPLHATFAAVLGLYLGVGAHWAGSTRPAIACHVTNNVVAVVLAAGTGRSGATWASVATGCALSLVCLWSVARGRRSLAAARAVAPTHLPPGPA